jgi:hypothetical protein
MWYGTTTEKKTKSPRIHRSKREGIGNRAVALATWRLYPERSITSHRFCGSGRLFPGLEAETRRAEIMTESVVQRTLAIPNAGKGIPSRFGCQDNSGCTQWLGTESNRRHADFQSAALPTELPSRPTVWTGQLTQSRSSNQPGSDQRFFSRLDARPGASIAWASKSWSSSSVTLAQLGWRRGSRRRCVLSSPSKQIHPS